MFKDYSKRIFDLIMKPEMKILPGQLAYFLILSIFPLLTLLGYIGSKVTLLSSPFISIISKFLPNSFNDILLPFLTKSSITGNVAFVRQLMSLGFDTLIIRGKISGMNKMYALKKFANLSQYYIK